MGLKYLLKKNNIPAIILLGNYVENQTNVYILGPQNPMIGVGHSLYKQMLTDGAKSVAERIATPGDIGDE